MLIESPGIVHDSCVTTDICIIGSGPAGITLARELMGQASHVCLLDSGSKESNVKAQDLSVGHTIGEPFLSLQATRNRQFGGNSNVWSIKTGRDENRQWTIGVRYVPLSDIDFQEREWVPHSGWPISREELVPYYERAQRVADSGPFAYEPEFWAAPPIQPVDFGEHSFQSVVYQFGRRNVFYEDYYEELKAAPNVDIHLDATVVELEMSEDNTCIQKVQVKSLTGKTYWVEAKVFVLATGGIEVARLMLASTKTRASGVGNENDLVGRFFMDHPLVDAGRLYPANPQDFQKAAFYDLRKVNGHPVMGHLMPSNTLMAEHHLLNTAIVLFPRPKPRQTQAILALKELVEQGYLKRPVPAHWSKILGGLIKVAGGMDYVLEAIYLAKQFDQSLLHGFGRGGWAEQPQIHGRFQSFEVLLATEQAPDPNNRVQLGSDRDALGMPRVELNWHWGQANIDSVRRTQDLLASAVEQAGLGKMVPFRRDGQPYLSGPAGLAHHLGTTRMSSHPSQGVVNENCQVHSVPNLYVASSAVFPTGGYANPTLTILALSLRLADHLKTNVLNTYSRISV